MGSGTFTKEAAAKVLRDAHGGLSLRDATELVDAILDGIQDGLLSDGRVKIRGFGTFELRTRPARLATHPGTGQPVSIAESLVVAFRGSPKLLVR